MGRQYGDHTPQRRKGRTLSVPDPLVTAAVAAITISDFNLGETTRWGNRLMADARRWAAGRIVAPERRLTKVEPSRVLSFELVRLGDEGGAR